jgi:hypothetical protein
MFVPPSPRGGDDGRILALNSVGGVDNDGKMHGRQKMEKKNVNKEWGCRMLRWTWATGNPERSE